MPQHSVAYLLLDLALFAAGLAYVELARRHVSGQVATAFRHGVDCGVMLAVARAPATVEADR